MSASTVGFLSEEERARSEPAAKRIIRLQAEAKALAHEHVKELQEALEIVHRLAAEIADGGAAYPVGVREISRRLTEEADMRARGIEAVLRRGRPTIPAVA
jgi:hypothetical protein